jgi:hypothetical protein
MTVTDFPLNISLPVDINLFSIPLLPLLLSGSACKRPAREKELLGQVRIIHDFINGRTIQ